MNKTILRYLICPAHTPNCSSRLIDERESLSCACGRSYRKIGNLIALRDIDEQRHHTSEHQQRCAGDGYYQRGFVNMFLMRQFGSLVRVSKFTCRNPASRVGQQLDLLRYGGEMFYQCLLNVARPYICRGSVILDIGCGTGRLTGEFAKSGAELVVGLDYSPDMLEAAERVVCGRKGETIKFQIQSSRLARRTATINGWGIKNCSFVIADVHALPIRKQSIDVIACINLLHRVRKPKSVMQEIERALKQQGVLLASNSYDWNERYTPRSLWFDNFREELNARRWRVEDEIAALPYIAMMYDRKYVIAFNHVHVFRKVN